MPGRTLALLPLTFSVLGTVRALITCSGVTGAMTFSPPVKVDPSQTLAQGISVQAKAGKCAVKFPPGAVILAFPWKRFLWALAEAATSGFGGLLGAIVSTILSTAYGPELAAMPCCGKKTGNSQVGFSSYKETFTKSGDMVFTFPAPGGMGSAHGAFAGPARGTFVTNMTYAQAKKLALSKTGQASVPIVSGTITMGAVRPASLALTWSWARMAG